MDSVTREDLKRNELGEAIGGAIHYAEDHSRTILRILAAIAVAGVIGLGIYLWTSSRSRGANELLVRGLKVYDAQVLESGAKPDDEIAPTFASVAARQGKAKEIFTELEERFGGTRTGRVAKLYLAQIALAEKDSARARAFWQAFLDAEPRGTLAATARVNVWKLDRGEGKAEAVANELKAILDSTDKPLPDDVLLYQLALSYEALGRTGDAAATYRRLIDEHPQSPYFAEAQREAGPAPKES